MTNQSVVALLETLLSIARSIDRLPRADIYAFCTVFSGDFILWSRGRRLVCAALEYVVRRACSRGSSASVVECELDPVGSWFSA